MDAVQEFVVKIYIHELTNCRFVPEKSDLMPNPFIQIRVGNETCVTPTVEESNMVTFNSQFSIVLNATVEELGFNLIDIRVLHAYTFSNVLIGMAAIGCSYVYGLSRHFLNREWVPIRHDKYPETPCGQLLISVGIFGHGDDIPTDDFLIVDTLNVPTLMASVPTLISQVFNLTINIFRGQNIFQPVEGQIGKESKATFIRISHAGFTSSTVLKSGVLPEWNTSFIFPVFIPSLDPHVLIELVNEEQDTTGGAIPQIIRVDKLIHETTKPRWLNFYYRPKALFQTGLLDSWLSKTRPIASQSGASAYAGRILYSSEARKVELCSPVVTRPCGAVIEPPQVEHVIYLDVYDVVSENNNYSAINVQLSVGVHNQMSPCLSNKDGRYPCDEDVGRLPVLKLYLPPSDQMYDFFVYIMANSQGVLWSASALDRIAFMRDSLSAHLGFNKFPSWFQFHSVADNDKAFMVLMSVEFGPLSEQPERRSERVVFHQERYVFRAMIYEAIHIPPASETGLSDTFLSIQLFGRTACTRVIKSTIHPIWYESFEFLLELPNLLKLAPYIKIDVWSKTNDANLLLGYFQYPVDNLPLFWEAMPIWCDVITSPNFKCAAHPKVLCSFELLPDTPDIIEKYPFYDDIRPSTKLATVYFFLVGIQLYEKIQHPCVRISYGRNVSDSGVPLWYEETDRPVLGSGGNLIFFKEVEIDAELPKRHYHNSYLELTIYYTAYSFQNKRQAAGYSYVFLTSHLPWLSREQKKIAKQAFKPREMIENQTIAGTDPEAIEGIQNVPNKDSMHMDKQAQKLHIPRFDLDFANANMYLLEDFFNLDDDEAEDSKKDPIELANTSKKEPEEPGLAEVTNSLKTSKEQSHEGSKSDSSLNFDLYLPLDGVNRMERDEVRTDLETFIGKAGLPYSISHVLQSTSKGSLRIVGHLKHICYISEPGVPDSEEKKAYTNAVNFVKQIYIDSNNLVVRVYILTVYGLSFTDSGVKPTIYPCVRNGVNLATHILPHSICDTENGRVEDIQMNYNTCYILNSNLPDYGLLHIYFCFVRGFSETIVGETYIDVESRWYNTKYQDLLENDTLPIELRYLSCGHDVKRSGALRTFIEIIPYEVSLSRPLMTMARSAPDNYQLRVVVWSVSQAPVTGGESVSLFVRGSFGLDGNNRQVQETDVHYNSTNGNARFNWRFVWNITLPSSEPYLKLQILSYMLFPQPSVILSECKVNLSYDFCMVHKKYTPLYESAKKYHVCTHPGYEGQCRGSILVEFSILPQKEADFTPVGKGRDNPNRNPYLEPVKENRTYIDWKTYQERLSSVGALTITTVQKSCYATGALGVIVFIFLILFLFR